MRFSVNHSKNFSFIFVSIILKAIHNKDYSVVKTFKAGQLAFFYFRREMQNPKHKKSRLKKGSFTNLKYLTILFFSFYIYSDFDVFADHPFCRIGFGSSEFNSPVCSVHREFSLNCR